MTIHLSGIDLMSILRKIISVSEIGFALLTILSVSSTQAVEKLGAGCNHHKRADPDSPVASSSESRIGRFEHILGHTPGEAFRGFHTQARLGKSHRCHRSRCPAWLQSCKGKRT